MSGSDEIERSLFRRKYNVESSPLGMKSRFMDYVDTVAKSKFETLGTKLMESLGCRKLKRKSSIDAK